ncbi:hypothetical protein [Apilactobacillus nanyangensis]|nr:hypothetical protein [Apilactobacillus nanyangensis]
MLSKIIQLFQNKKAVNSPQVNDRNAITANAIIDFNLTKDGRYIQGDE